MKIAQDLAGYSLGEADLLRRARGKKKKSEMEKHQSIFVSGASERGVDPKIAEGLFEQMVLFAEYCFNKSHSTAYGAVTYQTAYLKAHYPVAYMAALLTVNAGDTAKVQRYIANATAMGIEVMPPDINASGIDFTPVEGRILFGLSAIRNLGEGAIRQLIESRSADGPFTCLGDLCDRIPSQQLNRRALEALIHSGALDALEPQGNRAQLMADLELVLDWAQSRARDRASGQGNLLDLLGAATAPGPEAAHDPRRADPSTMPRAAAVRDYPSQEKLRLEKELVGFYLSDHPLKQVQRPLQLLSPIALASLDELADKAKVSAVVLISELRAVTTRKGDRMAVLQLEDLSGSCEAVVFPKSYARLADHLVADARLLLWASVDRRDDRVQLIVDACCGIDDLELLMVELPADQAGDITIQHRLRECLHRHRPPMDDTGSRVPVVALVQDAGQSRYVRLGVQFCVDNPRAALETLQSASFNARVRSPLRAA
jgi:DNA polymerase-3 subunit alpha